MGKRRPGPRDLPRPVANMLPKPLHVFAMGVAFTVDFAKIQNRLVMHKSQLNYQWMHMETLNVSGRWGQPSVGSGERLFCGVIDCHGGLAGN